MRFALGGIAVLPDTTILSICLTVAQVRDPAPSVCLAFLLFPAKIENFRSALRAERLKFPEIIKNVFSVKSNEEI